MWNARLNFTKFHLTSERNNFVSIPRVKLQIKVNQQTKRKESILLIKKKKQRKKKEEEKWLGGREICRQYRQYSIIWCTHVELFSE